ncbi:MAG TPA: cysteine-rich CWC family protein [Burkholderiales bacterium]
MSNAGATPKRCPDCGAMFGCGMGQDTPCWCSTEFAPVMPLPNADADCVCAQCLAKRIVRARQESAGNSD